MNVLTRSVDAAAIAAQLDSDGFVTLENVVDPGWIERAAAHIRTLVAQKGKRYFSVSWAARAKATPAAEIVDDPRMRRLLEELVRLGQPKARTDDEIYNAYRIVAGNQNEEGIVEAYLDVNCNSFERSTSWLLENVHIINGIPSIALETLAGFKAGYGRPKDFADLALLREHMVLKLPTSPQSAS